MQSLVSKLLIALLTHLYRLSHSYQIHVQELDGISPKDFDANEKKRRQDAEVWISLLQQKLVDTNKKVVDVGSGDGKMAQYFSTRLNINDLTCYDVCLPDESTQYESFLSYSCSSCHDTQMELPKINIFDGINISEPSDSVDLVTAVYSLHHAGDKQLELLKDIVRIVRPNGYILIVEDLNEPEFVERNYLHDCNGKFRTKVEWHSVFMELMLRCVHESECNKLWVPKGPQYYFLLQHN